MSECIIPNCRGFAPAREAFCKKHRDRRPQTKRVHFEWRGKGLVANRCWNKPFWYGDGSDATEPSVIMRLSDYRRLMRLGVNVTPERVMP